MSNQIDNVAVKTYSDDVAFNFQQAGSLMRSCTRKATKTSGKTHTFRRTYATDVVSKQRNQKIPVSNQNYDEVECPIANYHALEYCDELDTHLTNVDETNVSSKSQGMAFGRKVDDVIQTGIQTITRADSLIGFDGTNAPAAEANLERMTLDNALEAYVRLANSHVYKTTGGADTYAFVGPRQWTDLVKIDEFSNADYVGMDDMPFKWVGKVKMKYWCGFYWMEHTNLPQHTVAGKANAATECQFWTKQAVGYVEAKAPETTIDWENDYDAHSVMTRMRIGSIPIWDTGVIRLIASNAKAN